MAGKCPCARIRIEKRVTRGGIGRGCSELNGQIAGPVPVEEIELAVMFPALSTVALAPGVLTEDAVAAATIAPGVNPLK